MRGVNGTPDEGRCRLKQISCRAPTPLIRPAPQATFSHRGRRMLLIGPTFKYPYDRRPKADQDDP
ncbi:hypothetical protein HMPREF0185_02829 [Brevundimonas diminuta 470-4]|nr:hypothetical protein HMPREF0185_02829 [Brevundimonas diminuta 470-4]